MLTNTSDDYKHLPKMLPGDHLAQFHTLPPFAQERINLGFDQDVQTDQTAVIQSDSLGQADSFITNSRIAMSELTKMTIDPHLNALRAQLHSVAIIPFPMKTILVVASTINYVQDVTLPDNTQMVMFTANPNADFFVSVNGQIQFPVATDTTGGGAMYSPRDQWFYVKGLKNLSIGLPTLNAVVSMLCHIQT